MKSRNPAFLKAYTFHLEKFFKIPKVINFRGIFKNFEKHRTWKFRGKKMDPGIQGPKLIRSRSEKMRNSGPTRTRTKYFKISDQLGPIGPQTWRSGDLWLVLWFLINSDWTNGQDTVGVTGMIFKIPKRILIRHGEVEYKQALSSKSMHYA